MNLSIIYKTIADLINNSQEIGEETVTYLDNMIDTLSNSEIVEGSTDRQRLESQINATSEVMTNRHQFYTRYVRDLVFALHNYLDVRYSSVYVFLSDYNIQVLPTFADISEAVGYLIDDVNIET